MAPASVVGVVYLGVAGTDVVGLVISPDRSHGGPVGSDPHPRWPSITGFLGATPKAARSRARPRRPCVPPWLST